MKKESLSIIAVKTLLAVVIFTGVGTIIIGGWWLINNMSGTDNLAISLSETEITKEKAILFAEKKCVSVEEILMKIKVYDHDDIKKIDGKWRIPRVDTNYSYYTEVDIKTGEINCMKSEMHPVFQEITITIDKTEYEPGETVKITVKNNLNKGLKIVFPSYIVERLINDVWIDSKRVLCPCGAYCKKLTEDITLQEYDIIREKCYQKGPVWSSVETLSNQTPSGEYRIKIIFRDSDGNKKQTVYSNEFTIKEKTVLDLRCSEKVRGVGDCEILFTGYEFYPSLGACIGKKVGGCSIKTPFKTLEECQEICEKGKDVCMNEDDKCTIRDIDCCDGFKKALLINENEAGECSAPLPCGSICIPCGNGICDKDKRENKCNCPEDCK